MINSIHYVSAIHIKGFLRFKPASCCLNTSHPQQRPPGHYSSARYHGEALPARSGSASQREGGGGSGGGEFARVCVPALSPLIMGK